MPTYTLVLYLPPTTQICVLGVRTLPKAHSLKHSPFSTVTHHSGYRSKTLQDSALNDCFAVHTGLVVTEVSASRDKYSNFYLSIKLPTA